MQTEDPTGSQELREAIHRFDGAFADGRLDNFVACFAADARVLLHEQDALEGTPAIRASFAEVFALFDTSAYEVTYDLVEVRGDRGFVLASFEEVLRPRDGTPGPRIHGRAVHLWRRDEDGAWRVVRLLTGRSAPDEPAG